MILLIQTRIVTRLKAFDPILTGTYPLDIQIKSSDIDIICQHNNSELFKENLIELFGSQEQFKIRELTTFAHPAIVCSFKLEGYEFEIFGQELPTDSQMGYLHMVKEYEILLRFGDDFKRKVIALKTSGMKTEPAFCQLLNIEGDPYAELLKYELA